MFQGISVFKSPSKSIERRRLCIIIISLWGASCRLFLFFCGSQCPLICVTENQFVLKPHLSVKKKQKKCFLKRLIIGKNGQSSLKTLLHPSAVHFLQCFLAWSIMKGAVQSCSVFISPSRLSYCSGLLFFLELLSSNWKQNMLLDLDELKHLWKQGSGKANRWKHAVCSSILIKCHMFVY